MRRRMRSDGVVILAHSARIAWQEGPEGTLYVHYVGSKKSTMYCQ